MKGQDLGIRRAARLEIYVAMAYIFVVLVYNMGGHITQNLDQACDVHNAAACRTAMASSDTMDAVSREQLAEENAVPVCAATARDISQRYYNSHYLDTPWFPFVVDPSSLAHCDRCANEAQPDVGAVGALFLRSLRPSCMLARADMLVFVKGAWSSTGAAMWGAFTNLGTTSVGAAAVCAPLGPVASVCTPIVAVLIPLWGAMKDLASDVATTPRVVDRIICCVFSAAFLLTFAPRKPEFRYLYPNPYSWSWQTLAVWVCLLQAMFHANCESVERMMVATYTQYLLDCLDAAVKSGWDSLAGVWGTWFPVKAEPTLVLDPASNEYSHWFAMHQLRRMKLAATAAGTWEGMHKPASKCLRGIQAHGSALKLLPVSAWIDASQYALPAMCTHGLRPWTDEGPRARDAIFTATSSRTKLPRTAPRLQQNYYLQLQGACTWVDGRRKHVMLYFNPTDWDDFGGRQEGNVAKDSHSFCRDQASSDYGVAFGVTRRPFAQDEGDPRDYVPLWTSIKVRLSTGVHVCVRCDVLLHNKSGFDPSDAAFELHPATSGFGGIKSVVVPPVDEMLGGVSANTFGFKCGHQCSDSNPCSVMRLAKNVLVLVHPSDTHKLLQHETSSAGLHTAPPTAEAAGGEVLKVAGYQALSVIEHGTPYTDLGIRVGEPSLVPRERLGRYRPALECGVCAMYNSAAEASKLRDDKVPLLRESMIAASADMQALAQAGILSKSGAEWRPCDCNRVLERNREQHREYMAYQ